MIQDSPQEMKGEGLRNHIMVGFQNTGDVKRKTKPFREDKDGGMDNKSIRQ